MKKILGLDYGRKRFGVAISDALGVTAQPFDTFTGLTWPQIVDRLGGIIQQDGIQLIILGHPLNLKGEKGKMARETERFAEHLRKHLDIEVKLWDERFSSVQSMKALQAMGLKTGHDKGRIDRMAATIFLQSYLDYIEMNNPDTHSGEES